MESIQAVRGMNDILPGQIEWWQKVERLAREVLENFGYREIRTPVVEKLELFSRGIGESTDIVEKEMYALPTAKANGSPCVPKRRRPLSGLISSTIFRRIP